MNPWAAAVESRRKFSIAIMAYLGTLTALGWGWIDGAVYQHVTVGVIGLYMAGNVGEHFARREK